ncbi:methionine adenosyltransferase 2 subunit beta-like isoform X1 [Mytilus edulis]|uniref:methionine adenosyltransferase 2 subunit beta-like isoform X1 n=2 Tax=Mytilus edulis TaxID=6550 RepID=UPI0039EE2228
MPVMSKKVLITGASGLLGRAVYKEFVNEGSWEVLGLAFSRCTGKLRKCDITKDEEVKTVMKEFNPSVVIHSAAERKPDAVEKKPEATQQLNVSATKVICQNAAAVGAWVLYISTDYVFEGTSPPYKEDAIPNPLNKYGQSKFEGEKVTMEVSQDNSILRVPILYGDIEYLDESAVTTLFQKVTDSSKPCPMSDYERRFPTHCDDIAYVIRQLADKRIVDNSIKGVYHWSGDENMTKYDMALVMAEVFSLPSDHIQPDKKPSPGASRPFNSQLSCQRLKDLGIAKHSQFQSKILNVLKPYYKT